MVNGASEFAVDMLDAALRWARAGVPVFPLHEVPGGVCSCGDRGCKSPGKHPLSSAVPHGVDDATTDPSKITQWWTDNPNANIGGAMGGRSGVWTADVDGTEAKA